MTKPVRIHRTLAHCGGRWFGGTAGDSTVVTTLIDLIGDDFVAVEIEREEGRFALIIDISWVEFALKLAEQGQDLVDVGDLPRSILRAVVSGWTEDWNEEGSTIEVSESTDGVPHLREVTCQVRLA